jgi:3-methyladenine DNA glycosylase AlkD
MGSTLGLTHLKLVWMPTRSIFDDVLEGIARHTANTSPEISYLFANSISKYTGGMLYIDHWTNPQDFQVVLNAVKKHREDAINNIDTWQLTDIYFTRVDELIDLLKKKIEELTQHTN